MTPLGQKLAAQIAQNGPMRMDAFMAACLSDAEHGYYIKNHPIGAAGDFTTAPEISQLFGEMIGLWLAQVWLDMGKPERVTLAELGPGRGTMMADILRIAQQVPGFAQTLNVQLVEISPTLRRTQAETLGTHPFTHIGTVDELPSAPLLLVANEFFDALPVRQLQRAGDIWLERCVDYANEKLEIALRPITDPLPLPMLPDGAIYEVNNAAHSVTAKIGEKIEAQGGAALIVDYGQKDGAGDTLQAVHRHKPEPMLARPGEADLSAHVRFADLAQAASPAKATAPIAQGIFLERMGITARANQLCKAAIPDQTAEIELAHRRLTHPDEMGTLFQAMAIGPSTMTNLPGFEQ